MRLITRGGGGTTERLGRANRKEPAIAASDRGDVE